MKPGEQYRLRDYPDQLPIYPNCPGQRHSGVALVCLEGLAAWFAYSSKFFAALSRRIASACIRRCNAPIRAGEWVADE